tara:strand:- start:216 stop:443 length:228 start_codon:yes stop_codon:yes gene_type:complete
MKTILISILFFDVVYNMIAIWFLLRCIKKIADTVEHLFVFVIRGNIFDIDVVGGGDAKGNGNLMGKRRCKIACGC